MSRIRIAAALAALAAAAAAFASGGQAGDVNKPETKAYEAISLTGDKLVSPPADKAALDRYAEARQRWARDPSEENAIGLGRSAASAGRYREAIKAFTDGLARYPRSFRLLRHRGHRYITIRQIVRAIDDLAKAEELAKGKPLEAEADFPPNPAAKPTSNTQYNILFHLGLAHYLAGDYPLAERAYRECLTWARNDDSKVAATDGLYLTLRRMRMDAAARDVVAAIKVRGIDLKENFGYFQRILMYRGMASPDLMTLPWDDDPPNMKKADLLIRLYGLANWHLWGGDAMRATGVFDMILKENAWSYFASISAEFDAAGLMLVNPAHGTVAEALKTWTLMWNMYDLGLVYTLFSVAPVPAYVSAEKNDPVVGFEPIVEYHKGAGFVAGGTAQDGRLWLEDVRIEMAAGAPAKVTARWFLDRNVGGEGRVERGPATFILVPAPDGYRISQARFVKD